MSEKLFRVKLIVDEKSKWAGYDGIEDQEFDIEAESIEEAKKKVFSGILDTIISETDFDKALERAKRKCEEELEESEFKTVIIEEIKILETKTTDVQEYIAPLVKAVEDGRKKGKEKTEKKEFERLKEKFG